MFYLYMGSLKKKADDNKILDTISELNNVTLRMNEMLTSVGKDKAEYEKVIINQLLMLFDYSLKHFTTKVSFENQYSTGKVKI